MKKILILLIGFAFTQSIQTKQVEVTITEWGDINQSVGDSREVVDLADYLNLDYGAYLVEVAFFEILSPNMNSDDPFWLEMENCYGSMDVGGDSRSVRIRAQHDPFNNPEMMVLYPDSKLRLDNGCTSIYTDYNGIWLAEMIGLDYFPLKFTFYVTGMFDDLIPAGTGDMNLDGIINVVDIVALVSIILGDRA